VFLRTRNSYYNCRFKHALIIDYNTILITTKRLQDNHKEEVKVAIHPPPPTHPSLALTLRLRSIVVHLPNFVQMELSSVANSDIDGQILTSTVQNIKHN